MYAELKQEFQSKGIPVDKVDFFDHPNFLRAEQFDDSYLVKFAKFVAEQTYSDEYLDKAEEIITGVCSVLSSELIENGREGACADIAGILSRILERKGVWSCCINGSSTIEFPKNSGEETTYFWAVDNTNVAAAHAWVFAPPFSIIDITLKQQPYTGNKKQFIPEIICIKDAENAISHVEDIISPEVVLQMNMQRVPKDRMLEFGASQLQQIQDSIPAKLVTIDETRIKYSPVAIFATDKSLPKIKTMKFSGLSPFQMYKQKIEKQVGKIT
ncbi:hypothetical protein [Pseudoalteromonas sp. ECSMB14103]|uniref:hypothetical protein n=1 Tax=Pseudoalteromonas sp. ECSMB14103 TaxID=1580062 RepID=UPI00057B0125|nr:hypothetical protein [Pseudoalteromonas sp. ECSMB14103]